MIKHFGLSTLADNDSFGRKVPTAQVKAIIKLSFSAQYVVSQICKLTLFQY